MDETRRAEVKQIIATMIKAVFDLRNLRFEVGNTLEDMKKIESQSKKLNVAIDEMRDDFFG